MVSWWVLAHAGETVGTVSLPVATLLGLSPISHKVFPVPWTSDTWTTAAFVKEVTPEVDTGVTEVSEPVFPEGLTLFLFLPPPKKILTRTDLMPTF